MPEREARPALSPLTKGVLSIATTVLVGIAGFIIGRGHHDPSPAEQMNVPAAHRARFDRLFNQELGEFENDPAFLRELDRRVGMSTSGESADAIRGRIAQDLAAHGLRRLDLAALDAFVATRLTIALHSEPVCAAMWTGRVDQTAVVQALTTLSDADLRQFFHLTAIAARLELAATSPMPPDANAARDGLVEINRIAPQEDAAAIDAATNAGEAVSQRGACDAILAVLRNAPRLQPDQRQRFIRGMFGR